MKKKEPCTESFPFSDLSALYRELMEKIKICDKEIKGKKRMNQLILWEYQKKRICEYYECIDGCGNQYPGCDFQPSIHKECPFLELQKALSFVNQGEDDEKN